jgi:hypothetical protein
VIPRPSPAGRVRPTVGMAGRAPAGRRHRRTSGDGGGRRRWTVPRTLDRGAHPGQGQPEPTGHLRHPDRHHPRTRAQRTGIHERRSDPAGARSPGPLARSCPLGSLGAAVAPEAETAGAGGRWGETASARRLRLSASARAQRLRYRNRGGGSRAVVPALERAGSGCAGLASARLASTTTTPGAGERAGSGSASSRRPSGTPGQARGTAPSCASAWLGTEAGRAWASIDRVRWRYQLGQYRTSSWSSPVSPFRLL